jgi:hypothetical protein
MVTTAAEEEVEELAMILELPHHRTGKGWY